VILRSAYDRAGQTCPWQFWNDSDVRTMVLLGKQLGFDPKRNMPFDGVAHNALADARHQAKYVSAIWQSLFPPPAPKNKPHARVQPGCMEILPWQNL
jgi:hypothetical protein